MRDALRVLHSIGDASRRPLGNAEQGERLPRIGDFNHSLQILDPSFEGEIADIPVGHTTATFIMTHEAEVVAEEANPMSPNRTLPFVLEVGHPVSGLDQNRTRPGLGPGYLDSVPSAHISNSLGGPLA